MKIIVTVFDALMLFLIGYVCLTASERKTIGISIFMEIIFIINVLYIWMM